MKKALPLVAAAVAVALALGACGSPTGGQSTAPVSAGWDVNEQPRSAIKDGGEFRGPIGSEINTWNLMSALGNDGEMKLMQSPLTENWLFEDGSGNHTVNPNYLDSLTDEMVDGKLVVKMTINQKAVWNDGAPITYKDWVATWLANNGTNPDFSAAATDGWDSIESIEQGETERDVVITFVSAYPDWRILLVGCPMRAESAVDPATFNDGWGDYVNAWYSGPYVVTSFDKATSTVVMERNPIWWGDQGKLDKITWKYVSPDQQATAFANGEIDYIDIATDADKYAQVSATPGAAVRNAGSPNFRHITFNTASPVLSDVAVRQAIVMGLDRSAIAQSDLAGLPLDTAKAEKNSNLYFQGMEGYVDYAEKTGVKYDPAGAKKKLEEAGYTLGADGYYAKDGQTLTVRFAVLTGVRTSENEGQLAMSQLKEVGIKIELQPVNTATDWPGVLIDANFDLIAFSWMGTAFPLANISQLYGTGSDSNYAQLTTPVVDELVPQIASENDEVARQTLAQKVDEALWTNVHTLPLYQRPALIGVKADLANIGSLGLAVVPLTWVNVGYTA